MFLKKKIKDLCQNLFTFILIIIHPLYITIYQYMDFLFWNNCSKQVIFSYTAFLLAPEERQIQRTEAVCLTQFLF